MLAYNVSISLLLAMGLLVPLVVKWELSRALTLPTITCIGIAAGLIIPPISTAWALPKGFTLCLEGGFIVATAAALFFWRFFRDPERTCADAERAILSAADGKVIYVKRFEAGQIPVSEKHSRSFALEEFTRSSLLPTSGYLIGTSMTYLDVHVNRAPIHGRVRLLHHIGGSFASLKHKEAIFQNERVATVIENPELMVGIVQIASRLVRNIIPFVDADSVLQQGQRIGKIRFGSQVDLIVPDKPNLKILVATGDKLKAGISKVAHY